MGTIDSEAIRRESIAALARWDLPDPEPLPRLDDGDFEWARPVADVVARCHAMAAAIAVSQGAPVGDVLETLRDEDLERFLAERERGYLRHRAGEAELEPEALEQSEIDVTWRQEALWALLWALGFVEALAPDELCGDSSAYERMAPDMDPARTVDGVELRPLAELAPMIDLYYCLHWHLREDEIRNAGWPDAIAPGVVLERRTALEWLFQDQPWDEVDTST